MVMMALNRTQTPFDREKSAALRRAIRWVIGMQCRDGGWAAFDRDNDKWLFTQVPFADHNAMIDPSTSDITGRVLECLSHFGFTTEDKCVQRAIEFLKHDQCADGSWYGAGAATTFTGRGRHCAGCAASAKICVCHMSAARSRG